MMRAQAAVTGAAASLAGVPWPMAPAYGALPTATTAQARSSAATACQVLLCTRAPAEAAGPAARHAHLTTRTSRCARYVARAAWMRRPKRACRARKHTVLAGESIWTGSVGQQVNSCRASKGWGQHAAAFAAPLPDDRHPRAHHVLAVLGPPRNACSAITVTA